MGSLDIGRVRVSLVFVAVSIDQSVNPTTRPKTVHAREHNYTHTHTATNTNMSTIPTMTPKMRREMKAKELKKLTELGSDVPAHLLPTPLTIPSTPTPYPIKMATFNKLFWQTGTNVKFDLFRLNPAVYPSTLCLVPTNLDDGGELNRLFVDQGTSSFAFVVGVVVVVELILFCPVPFFSCFFFVADPLPPNVFISAACFFSLFQPTFSSFFSFSFSFSLQLSYSPLLIFSIIIFLSSSHHHHLSFRSC